MPTPPEAVPIAKDTGAPPNQAPSEKGTNMAHAGEILDNPITGERIIFRETAADTGGELLVDASVSSDR